MLFHHAKHRLAVLGVLAERTLDLGHPGRLGERASGHDRGDRARETPAFVRVVGQAHRHQQCADVRVAEPERPERFRVFADRLGRVGGVGDEDLLAREADVDGALQALHVERPLRGLELHQVQRQEVACRVVEENELRARVGGVDPARVGHHVPVLDRGVELKAWVAADPRRVSNLAPQVTRLVGVDGPAADDGLRLPLFVVDDSPHEVIGHTDRVIGVLELD